METIVEVKNLRKTFGKQEVLKGISFTIQEHEIVGFIGPNGAGKSTTMKCLCNLIFPTSGEIKICGYDLKKDREKALAVQSSLIETPGLYPYMSGLENLKVFAALRHVGKERIDEIIKFIHISDKDMRKSVSKYSLGMKQRLGIGIALLPKPRFLILDEPTNGLDPKAIMELREFLKQLVKEEQTSILFSSHSLGEIEKISDRIICINQGSIVPTPDVFYESCGYHIKLDKEIDIEELQALPFVKKAEKQSQRYYVILHKESDLQKLMDEIHMQKQCDILEISKEKIDVEELYKEIYGDAV